MPPAVREFDADGDGVGPVLAQGVGPHQADDLGPLVLLLGHGLPPAVWKSAGPAARGRGVPAREPARVAPGSAPGRPRRAGVASGVAGAAGRALVFDLDGV